MTPLIVADDFSGACDAAARAAVHGYRAAALLETPLDETGLDLLAISTESRHLAEEAARERIRALEPLLRGRALYKKIDSTLRGPWIAEVDELLVITDYAQAVVCPAFPAMGRTVRDGWLWLEGEPAQKIECPFTVRDAATEEDLARIAAGVCSSILPVGSAGLAGHVFAPGAGGRPGALAAGAGDWIVLIGSDHPASQSQLRFLRQQRRGDWMLNPPSYPEAMAGVFATGGETASRFLRSTEARGLGLLRELLPGIAAGRILGGRYNGTVMITKAGGFGAADAIVRAIDALQAG